MRSSDSDRDLYSMTKKRVAEESRATMNNYSDAKTAAIDVIMRRAADARARHSAQGG